MTALLFSSYFPPIQYFSKILLHDSLMIEHWEHFPKQTYRNRCHIYGANGLLKLSIPVKHGNGEHTPMKEIQMANDTHWRKIHWRSIESAYRCSPYFEFFEDALHPLYEREYKHLIDFNQAILEVMLRSLKINMPIHFTEKFQENYPENIFDYRNAFHSKIKQEGSMNNTKPYHQVFDNKFGFIENLSILDLLCNEGPNSKAYLEDNLKTV